MGIKETINKLTKKENLLNENNESVLLDDKINDFIDWYYDNMVKGKYSEVGEYYEPIKMKNAIEKMVSWYEFIYPDFEVLKYFDTNKNNGLSANDIMFKNNKYINKNLKQQSFISSFNWSDFFNYSSFLKLLSWEEREMLSYNHYPSVVYLNISKSIHNPHFHLNSKGYITSADEMDLLKTKDGELFSFDDFNGKHLKEALKILKEHNVKFPKEEIEIENIIDFYEKREKLRDEFLNCVMYRIIERGGSKIGPRRGFIFAQEFNRNIDIPMKYGVDFTDSNLRIFIDKYISIKGESNLECIDSYFTKFRVNNKLEFVNLHDLIKNVPYDCKSLYTDEEENLQEKLDISFQNEINQKVKKLSK